MESIEELKPKIRSRIGNIIDGTIDDLTDIWLDMFGEDSTRENLTKLVDHAESFMNEIIEETVNRKDTILAKVADLCAEKKRLQTLLQCAPLDTEHLTQHPLFNYQVQLDQHIQLLRNQVAERRAQIEALCAREHSLCTVLGQAPAGLPLEPLPSAEDVENFEWRLEELTTERAARAQRTAELRASIEAMCAAMEMELPREVRANNATDAEPTLSTANIAKLAEYERVLLERKVSIRKEIRGLQLQLRRLYTRLEMSPRSRQVQLPERLLLAVGDANDTHNVSAAVAAEVDDPADEAAVPYTKTTIDRLRAEVDRCERIKRQNIQRFVEKVRRQIERLWDVTMRSDTERARFTHFTNDYYTEDLLQMHELELGDLERFYEENAELFRRIDEHKTLWERLLALEAKEKEPGRYKNRGGQLLLEEKERRTIATKVPKILADIERLIGEYNERNETRPFTIWGRSVDDHIAEMHEARLNSKEQQMSARKATTATPRTAGGAGLGAASGGVSSVQRSMLMGAAVPGRTPMSMSRMASATGGGASLKRMASVTNINPTSSTKKLRIHTAASSAGITPAKPTKRNILTELAPSCSGQTPGAHGSSKKAAASTSVMHRTAAGVGDASKLAAHRFVRPAARTAGPTTSNGRTVVVDSLAVGGKSSRRRSRRKSVNKSASKLKIQRVHVTDCSSSQADDSYQAFEVRVKTDSRSSVLPGNIAPAVAPEPSTSRQPSARTARGGAGHTPGPLRMRRLSPSAAIVASTSRRRSPSPGISKLSSRSGSNDSDDDAH